MRSFLALFILVLVVGAYAQEIETNDILLTSNKRNGVYRSFSEFRTNSPSITGQLKITANRVKVLNEQTGKFENVNEDFWGICRNDTIYVYLDETATAQSPHIHHVEFIGRYCYFLDLGGFTQPGPVGGSYTGSYQAEYVVNINNGSIYKLDKKLMRSILAKDPALLQQFEKEEAKGEVFREYILKINDRRKMDIKPANEVVGRN